MKKKMYSTVFHQLFSVKFLIFQAKREKKNNNSALSLTETLSQDMQLVIVKTQLW